MVYDRGFDSAERRIDRGATGFVREAHERAGYWLASKSVNPKQLANFDPTMVARDQKTVQRLETLFVSRDTPQQMEERMISTIFEVSLWWLTRQCKFFGERASAVLPSRFDDYVNGTDLVLEIMSTDEQIAHLGLGIDATFGTNAVCEKLSELHGNVLKGKSTEIKYFKSSDGKIEGTLREVPHAIVGLSVGRAKEVGVLWRMSEKGEKLPVSPEVHPLRVLILQQLTLQASTLSRLAAANGHKELSDSYSAIHKRLRPVYEKALGIVRTWVSLDGTDYRQDPVHLSIIAETVRWGQEAHKLEASKG